MNTDLKRKVRKPVKITQVRPSGPSDQVVTLEGGSGAYRRQPCGGCPWVKENAGTFPSSAFVHSASTAYDLSERRFGCHESGTRNPATCAGFLLRGADHNLAVRLDRIQGRFADDVDAAERELFEGYLEMAIANGVDPGDPALTRCR